MTYVIRDSGGIMKASLPDNIAGGIIKMEYGYFRPYNSKLCVDGICYQILEPFISKFADMKFYFWEGDVLYKSNV